MRNVPFGAIKEHTCPSRTFPALPAAHLSREPLLGWKAAVERGFIPLLSWGASLAPSEIMPAASVRLARFSPVLAVEEAGNL